MDLNFSNSTPAAPAGNQNAKWQVDANGNVSAYVPLATCIWSGSGNPNGTFTSGQPGDFYLDTATGTLYGPKSGASTWPAIGVIGGGGGTNITVNGQPIP